jgi:hypothetical protein
MNGLVRFETAAGQPVVVEVDTREPGFRPAGAGKAIAEARARFEEALGGVHDAAEAALRVFRDGRLKPDGVEIEFGVKLNAEAGAVIAKTAVEGHLLVKLSWSPEA